MKSERTERPTGVKKSDFSQTSFFFEEESHRKLPPLFFVQCWESLPLQLFKKENEEKGGERWLAEESTMQGKVNSAV